MSDARIYKPGSAHLIELLTQATSPSGATLLIPDLQRPFRWSPTQVTRLLDSLMRGWPFGTLPLWALDDEKIADIPYRPFWKLVDRVASEGSAAVAMDPPVRRGYRMVLDGQQRIQSLVVALSGDAGFRLDDREWWASLDPDRPPSRSTGHWSRGVLCLDLDEYAAQRTDPAKVRVQHVDYTKALRWVVTAAQGGRSTARKPSNYADPLLTKGDHSGRFIQLSRLWNLAQVGPTSVTTLMPELQEQVLPEHGVSGEAARKLLPVLLDLVVALGQVKQTEVGFLELQPMQKGASDPEQYDDAIVSIFTRLNAGGRALSEEEITFAWIKKFWARETAASDDATPAFEKLKVGLADRRIHVAMDKLVQAVSAAWSVLEADGRLLRSSDLVKGEKLRPLAPGISRRWARLSASFVETAALLEELELEHGAQYESIHAFVTLACWRCIGEEWLAAKKRPTVVEHNVRERLGSLVREHALRFLALTAWAGRWSHTSNAGLERYAAELAEDHAALRDANEPNDVLEKLEKRLTGWIADAVPKAVEHVQTLEAGRREDVRWYFLPLWIWHRLDADRRLASDGINLPKTRKKPETEVDHIVSHASWHGRLDAGEGSADWADDVNSLGNCFLLQKNFNVSKLDRPLGELLGRITRYALEKDRIAWTALMSIPAEMVDPTAAELGVVREGIRARTEALKKDLEAFVRDEKMLADTAPSLEIGGAWQTSYLFDGKPVDAPMQLQQDGSRVTGEYGAGNAIEGELKAHTLRGTWREGKERGLFEWVFVATGTSFSGHWASKADAGGTWSGQREPGPAPANVGRAR